MTPDTESATEPEQIDVEGDPALLAATHNDKEDAAVPVEDEEERVFTSTPNSDWLRKGLDKVGPPQQITRRNTMVVSSGAQPASLDRRLSQPVLTTHAADEGCFRYACACRVP